MPRCHFAPCHADALPLIITLLTLALRDFRFLLYGVIFRHARCRYAVCLRAMLLYAMPLQRVTACRAVYDCAAAAAARCRRRATGEEGINTRLREKASH